MTSEDPIELLQRAIRTLESTSLAEVERRAKLQTRTDRKYVLPIGLATRLVGSHREDLVALEIDGKREFRYVSQYYDTPERHCYHAAAGGRRRRFKVRTRTYDGDQTRRLEVKTRSRRGGTSKSSIDLPPDIADDEVLTGAGARFLGRELGTIGVDVASTISRLEPVVAIDYRRSTLVHATESSRITIDRGLTFGAPDTPAHSLDDFAIVETKSLGPPTPADRWLWRKGARPDRISKYAVAMAVLDPSLGGHKWARVLRDHFDRSAPGVRA